MFSHYTHPRRARDAEVLRERRREERAPRDRLRADVVRADEPHEREQVLDEFKGHGQLDVRADPRVAELAAAVVRPIARVADGGVLVPVLVEHEAALVELAAVEEHLGASRHAAERALGSCRATRGIVEVGEHPERAVGCARGAAGDEMRRRRPPRVLYEHVLLVRRELGDDRHDAQTKTLKARDDGRERERERELDPMRVFLCCVCSRRARCNTDPGTTRGESSG